MFSAITAALVFGPVLRPQLGLLFLCAMLADPLGQLHFARLDLVFR